MFKVEGGLGFRVGSLKAEPWGGLGVGLERLCLRVGGVEGLGGLAP